jgi:hypothetical protein
MLNRKAKILIIVGLTSLVFFSLIVTYFFVSYKYLNKQPSLLPSKEDNSNIEELIESLTPEVEINSDITTTTELETEHNIVSSTQPKVQTVNLPADLLTNIVWYYPISLDDLKLFNSEFIINQGDYSTTCWGKSASYTQNASFFYKGKQGRLLFLGDPCNEMGASNSVFTVIYFDGKYVVLNKYSSVYSTQYSKIFNGNKVVVDNNLVFSQLPEPPQYINTKYNGKIIRVKRDDQAYFLPVLPSFSNILEKASENYTDDKIAVYYWNPNFYIIRDDSKVSVYQPDNDFLQKGVPNVIWNQKGFSNSAVYDPYQTGVCGGENLSVVSSDEIDLNVDLAVVGKNNHGDNIYVLKDQNHKYLKNFYQQIYYPNEQGNKISYEEFLAVNPVFFWVDPIDRLIAFQLEKLQPGAECGKPVIYLYPEETTEVSVKLKLDKFTYSEPDYGTGWQVVAKPNGQLTEIKSGEIYPYLFWEGFGSGSVEENKKGFVIKKENVHDFLVSKLTELGLNDKESTDFREFWEPKMQTSPYYFVTFYNTADMNVIAPLFVNPKPNTIIRILMDYKPLIEPIQVEPQIFKTPIRKGFTVVEWGGVLR